MTIREAITMVNHLQPNQYDDSYKIKWLSKLDGMVHKELFMTHEGNPLENFVGYDENTDQSTELLVQYPFDQDVYNYFLQAQIAKENGEIAKYNQSITLYNNAYLSFAAWWNRDHRPIHTEHRFRF